MYVIIKRSLLRTTNNDESFTKGKIENYKEENKEKDKLF